jgi:hypothetical protein
MPRAIAGALALEKREFGETPLKFGFLTIATPEDFLTSHSPVAS